MTTLYKIAVWGGVCAVGVFFLSGLWTRHPVITFLAGQYPGLPQPFQLTEQEVADYRRDGFLLKRSLVSGDQLAASVNAGERLYSSFAILDLISQHYAKLRAQAWRNSPEFAQLAFESSFPTISAQLLNETKSVRILKDGFFGQVPTNAGCGFHVDDSFFWPAADDTSGVNFWVALSSTVAAQGGGIRVVNQSLISPETFSKCKAVIRGNDKKGGGYNSTCDMENLSPSCHQTMMDASVLYDMNPGDVILWDRWTFHRGEPFRNKEEDTQSIAAASAAQEQHKMRYTIRYIPSNAVAQGVLHPTVIQGEKFDSAFHPQVWPSYRKDEIDSIRAGMEEDMALGWKTVAILMMQKLGLA